MPKGGFAMNVYDFDNTLYKGESAFDFYIYCVIKKPQLLKVVFPVIKDLIKYKLCRMPVEEFNRRAVYYTETFFGVFEDIREEVRIFWDKKSHKIKSFYDELKKEDDVVISANVNILLDEILNRIGVKNRISTKFNLDTGKLEYICFSDTKLKLFAEKYGDKIDNFYTDSKNDLPLMTIADNVYLVKGNKIKKYK